MNEPIWDAMGASSLVEVDREMVGKTIDLELEDNRLNRTEESTCWQIDDRVDNGSSCSLE